MRRSIQPRVRSQGELYFEATGGGRARAELLNLSRGGLCARGELPRGARDEDRPITLQVALGLLDGTPPISASAAVAWVTDEKSDADAPQRFGLRFVDLSGDDQARLEAAIAARVDAVPIVDDRGSMRLRLSSGPVLRAEVESVDEVGALVGAELPWLRVGAALDAELDGAWVPARTSWVGLDVTPSGVARLRLRVAFHRDQPESAGRRDTTLRYFDVDAARVEPDESPEVETGATDGAGERAFPSTETATSSRPDESRAHELVRIGTRRRLRLAVLRTLMVMLSLSALYLAVRSLRHPAPAVADVPIEVQPVSAAAHDELPAPAIAVESERAPAIEEPPSTPAPKPVRKATPAKKARPRR